MLISRTASSSIQTLDACVSPIDVISFSYEGSLADAIPIISFASFLLSLHNHWPGSAHSSDDGNQFGSFN